MQPVGLTDKDRLQHVFLVGQTGTGKSTLLGNLTRQDAKRRLGFCLIDPHGDLAEDLHASLSVDHIYWDVADPACPIGYNPITRVSAAARPLVAAGFIDALKKQWHDAWGARMEHLLRYAVLALLEFGEGDMRDIVRMFVDKEFRRNVIAKVTDEQTRAFWFQEYPNMNYQSASDGVAPIANKLGAFLAHPMLRRALCEPEEPLRFRRLMDEGSPLIVNLSKGRLGADSANVLGGLLVTSLMNAAFTRQNIAPEKRQPFFLYVDEYHNFTTSAFASLMAEARKYGLGLTLAQQHLVQSDRSVTEAILGNVGSLIVCRVGPSDAPLFVRQLYGPDLEDLIKLPNYRAFAQFIHEGQKTEAFTLELLP